MLNKYIIKHEYNSIDADGKVYEECVIKDIVNEKDLNTKIIKTLQDLDLYVGDTIGYEYKKKRYSTPSKIFYSFLKTADIEDVLKITIFVETSYFNEELKTEIYDKSKYSFEKCEEINHNVCLSTNFVSYNNGCVERTVEDRIYTSEEIKNKVIEEVKFMYQIVDDNPHISVWFKDDCFSMPFDDFCKWIEKIDLKYLCDDDFRIYDKLSDEPITFNDCGLPNKRTRHYEYEIKLKYQNSK